MKLLGPTDYCVTEKKGRKEKKIPNCTAGGGVDFLMTEDGVSASDCLKT